MWPKRLERVAWKTPAALPSGILARRAEFLARRTGPQLKLLCRRESLTETEEAIVRVWQRLAPRFGVSKRVLGACAPFRGPRSVLAIGDTAAVVTAAEETFGDSARSYVAVETTAPRIEASKKVCGLAHKTEYSLSLVDVARRPTANFDVVACAWHLSELDDDETRDATLAVLWGCVRRGGVLAVFDAAEPLVQAARSRLVDPSSHDDPATHKATVVSPCPADGRCPLLAAGEKCTFPQMILPPTTGPPLRDADGNILSPLPKIEHFSYVVLRKPHPNDACVAIARPTARVVKPPRKRGGHVILDLCTPEAEKTRRLTITRAAMRDDADFSFRDARRATKGSLLHFEPRPDHLPKITDWFNTATMARATTPEE
ncbi:hypothetical protein CTAYLR_007337 [Chrysophaeum taylorii]|uniref:Methyltransferase n=1 Tax=Chrysophaeum taylorii TaxID=2483200 RepID=A0AAD7XP09_9STRA|nr:hypothetical protein CTAYLR_007337 [Chrysophaeum taylorii]